MLLILFIRVIDSFYYNYFKLPHPTNEYLDKIEKQIENSLDICYNIYNSSTFKKVDASSNLYSIV